MAQAQSEKKDNKPQGKANSDKLKNPNDLFTKFGIKVEENWKVLPIGFGYSKKDVDAGNIYLSPIRNKDYQISALKLQLQVKVTTKKDDANNNEKKNNDSIESCQATVKSVMHLKFGDPFRDCNKLHCTIMSRPTGVETMSKDIFENFGVRTTDDKADKNASKMLDLEDYNYFNCIAASNNNNNNNNDEKENKDNKDNKPENRADYVLYADNKDAFTPLGGWWVANGDFEFNKKQKLVLFFRALITDKNKKESKLEIVDDKANGKYIFFVC